MITALAASKVRRTGVLVTSVDTILERGEDEDEDGAGERIETENNGRDIYSLCLPCLPNTAIIEWLTHSIVATAGGRGPLNASVALQQLALSRYGLSNNRAIPFSQEISKAKRFVSFHSIRSGTFCPQLLLLSVPSS